MRECWHVSWEVRVVEGFWLSCSKAAPELWISDTPERRELRPSLIYSYRLLKRIFWPRGNAGWKFNTLSLGRSSRARDTLQYHTILVYCSTPGRSTEIKTASFDEQLDKFVVVSKIKKTYFRQIKFSIKFYTPTKLKTNGVFIYLIHQRLLNSHNN